MEATIRDATEADLDRISEIYNQTIIDSHISFDTEPYDPKRRRAWWEAREPGLPCLVAETEEQVIGVAYAGWYRPKVGYRSTVETTIVLDRSHTGRGAGTLLLGSLVDRLRAAGFHRAIAIIALPNDASIALHRKLGYRQAGTLTEVGTKLGRRWDTILFELALD